MTDAKLTFVHALIFDLDGTLIDSKQDWFIPSMRYRRIGARGVGRGNHFGLHRARSTATCGAGAWDGSTEEERQRRRQFFPGYYELHKMDTACAYPGVAETLAQLASLPMAVLTNKP